MRLEPHERAVVIILALVCALAMAGYFVQSCANRHCPHGLRTSPTHFGGSNIPVPRCR